MDFRRSGQLDERRRRVLRDELAQPAETETAESTPTPGGGSAKGPVRAYSPAVLTERQLRVIDLVPVRPIWASVVILLVVTAVAAIECIHIHVRTLNFGVDDHLAMLDASRPGGLASWFAGLLLAGGAALALVTFGIRVHRVDDYRGSYRIWLWTAAALAWASLDAATGVHDSLGMALAILARQPPQSPSFASACTISWLAVYALVFGTLAIRQAMEVASSLLTLSALAAAGLLYVTAGLFAINMLPGYGPLVDSVVRTTTVLLAHVALLSAVALYARHVYLDATGRLKVHIDPDKKRNAKKSRAKLKVVKDDKAADVDETTTVAEPASNRSQPSTPPLRFGFASQANPQPKATASISKSAASSADYEEDDEDDDGESYGGQRLSRAERRRLKKLARRRAA
jgi:hypothetical protein